MLTRIDIANFKALSERLSFETRPITLLVGENGVGKSSVLEAVALLAQSVRPPGRKGLQTNGRLLSLGDAEDPEMMSSLYHAGRSDSALSIRIGLRIPSLSGAVQVGIEVRGASRPWNGDWRQSFSREGGEGEIVFSAEGSPDGWRPTVAEWIGPEPQGPIPVGGDLSRVLDEGLFNPKGEGQGQGVRAQKGPADDVAVFLAGPGIRMVSALRGGALMRREPEVAGERGGANGEFTVRVLARILAQGDRRLWTRVGDAAARFGLKELSGGLGGGRHLIARYRDPLTRHSLDILSAGFGSQAALPIVLDLADAQPGSTVLVEEVEHSCHPGLLPVWAEVLATAASEWGVQVVATTHAPDLVLGFGRAVKKGLLRPEDVVIYELTRDGNATHAKGHEFSPAGGVVDGWLPSFARAEAELFEALVGDGEDG